MPAVLTACPTCGARGPDTMHPPACAHRASLRADVIRHAATAGITEHSAGDLWAHLRDIYSEGQLAHRAALNVIDLGWRPGGAQ